MRAFLCLRLSILGGESEKLLNLTATLIRTWKQSEPKCKVKKLLPGFSHSGITLWLHCFKIQQLEELLLKWSVARGKAPLPSNCFGYVICALDYLREDTCLKCAVLCMRDVSLPISQCVAMDMDEVCMGEKQVLLSKSLFLKNELSPYDSLYHAYSKLAMGRLLLVSRLGVPAGMRAMSLLSNISCSSVFA